MHYELSQLHPAIVAFLKSEVFYRRKDIVVRAAEKESIACGGGDGYKGFAIIGNLDTGECKITWGSWGGANMFNPSNRVDMDTTLYTIPVNGFVITGHIGGGKPTYASMTVHPDNLPKQLTAGPVLTSEEDHVLNAIGGYKSGDCRKAALERIANCADVIASLAKRGLLKVTKAGAVSITTAGKNARSNKRVF